jgi:hypothetical protein
MKKIRKFRLVLECVLLASGLVRLALVLLNMAHNYSRGALQRHASPVDFAL